MRGLAGSIAPSALRVCLRRQRFQVGENLRHELSTSDGRRGSKVTSLESSTRFEVRENSCLCMKGSAARGLVHNRLRRSARRHEELRRVQVFDAEGFAFSLGLALEQISRWQVDAG